MGLILLRIYSLSKQKIYTKNNTCSLKTVDAASPGSILKKNPESPINFGRSQQISWNLDELLNSYKTKFSGGENFGHLDKLGLKSVMFSRWYRNRIDEMRHQFKSLIYIKMGKIVGTEDDIFFNLDLKFYGTRFRTYNNK